MLKPNRAPALLSCSLAAALILSGCASNGSVVQITTNPVGAEARLEDGRACQTPCKMMVRDVTRLSIAKTGYKTRLVDITPSPMSFYTNIDYELELISASKPVEAVSLPSLDEPAAMPELLEAPKTTGLEDGPQFVAIGAPLSDDDDEE